MTKEENMQTHQQTHHFYNISLSLTHHLSLSIYIFFTPKNSLASIAFEKRSQRKVNE